MKTPTAILTICCVCLLLQPAISQADDAAPKLTGQTTKLFRTKTTQRFRMNPYHTNIGNIASVAADGTVRVTQISNPRFAFSRGISGRVDLTEGLYLGLVARDFVTSTKDTRLFRVEVVEIGAKNSATIRIEQAAASKLQKGEQIVFFRPPGSTTNELKAAPGFAPVDDGSKTSVLGKNAVNAPVAMSRSKNNLKQLGLAFHNFHDVYTRFPPAVVYGPDGKRWHSWRVSVLPFVDQAALYTRYRFDEPWDGPNNKKLLSEVPEVYRDPIYGNPDDNYTHYAVVTGKGTAFPTEGVKMDPKQPTSPLVNLPKSGGAKRIRDFTDGSSNSLLVGPVSPDRMIPWTKPEDIVLNEKFPALGQKGGFAAPYEIGKLKSGQFLICDGSVRTIRSDINMQTLRNLILISDGNVIGKIPGGGSPRPRPGVKAAQFIEIIRDAKGVRARLVSGPRN